jgi:hypothetical protein
MQRYDRIKTSAMLIGEPTSAPFDVRPEAAISGYRITTKSQKLTTLIQLRR